MNLLIRDLPDWVHRALKVEAAQTGKTLQGLVQEVLTAKAEKIKLPDLETERGKRKENKRHGKRTI